MEGLIAEVSDLSRRNDELMTPMDLDLVVIRDRDARLKEYSTNASMSRPRQSSQSKVCVVIPSFLPFARFSRSNSSLFLQKPKFDDQLPFSADGTIPDAHITAFLTAINSLLSAGRSNAPTHVLTPRKSVFNVVTTILDDMCCHSRWHSDSEGVRVLEERVERRCCSFQNSCNKLIVLLWFRDLVTFPLRHVCPMVEGMGKV